MKQKKIYVVLSRTKTTLSRMISYVKKKDYTHAAISLDDKLNYMYSFGRKYAINPFLGCFKHEDLDSGLYGYYSELPGVIIEVSVSMEQYEKIVENIQYFLKHRKQYTYNVLGLVGNAINMPMGSDLSFFCSEFVYYILNESGVCNFDKPRELVCPHDFFKLQGRIVFRGNLKEYREDIIFNSASEYKNRFSEDFMSN